MIKYYIAVIAVIFAMLTCTRAALAEDVITLNKDTVLFRADFDDDSAGKFIKDITMTGGDTIDIFLDSPGGSVMALDRMISAADALKAGGKKIRCFVDFAASAAFMLAESICDERIVQQHSVFMQHQAAFGVRGQTNRIASFYKFILGILDRLDDRVAKRLGISTEEYRAKSADDWWTSGDDAVKQGLADRRAFLRCDPELLKNERKYTIQVFIFTVNVTESSCPLIPPQWELATGGLDDREMPKASARERFEQFREHYTMDVLFRQ